MPDTTDLYTTVKNVSGASRYFPYLNKHGKTLASNATHTIFGDVQDQPGWNQRRQEAFERDLLAGRITILESPKAILRDDDVDAALANPTVVATVVVDGGGAVGGNLAAGHYRLEYTFYNEWGQTVSGGESADFTVAAGNIPRVTFPAIPAGATGIKAYLSDVAVGAVAAGAAKKYFNKITAGTTMDLDSASWNEGTQTFANAPAEPTTNTTAGHGTRVLKLDDDVLSHADPSFGTVLG